MPVTKGLFTEIDEKFGNQVPKLCAKGKVKKTVYISYNPFIYI